MGARTQGPSGPTLITPAQHPFRRIPAKPAKGTSRCQPPRPGPASYRPSERDTWGPPDQGPAGSVPYRATRVGRTKNAAWYNRRVDQASSRSPIRTAQFCRTPRPHGQQDPLTWTQCRPCKPTRPNGWETREGINKLHPARRNDGSP